MFTSRKKAAEEICKYFSVDVYYHPVCSAPEGIINKCEMHSAEEGMAGYYSAGAKMEKFILHRCDKLKELCDENGHLPAEVAFKYSERLETDKMAAVTINLNNNETRIHTKVGRNAPCPCGSGNKYKKCCGK